MGSVRDRLYFSSLSRIGFPLPPLPAQRRIVARIEELANRIAEALALREVAEREREALLQSIRASLLGSSAGGDWLPLRTYVGEIENGWSPECNSRPAQEGEWGVLKVGAVSFGIFNPKENKALPPTLSPVPRYEVKPGDFLMSRANNLDLVGACAIVEETRPKLMLCDKLFRFHFKDEMHVNHGYLHHVLQSPALRDQIRKAASGTSPTMKNISKDKVMELRLPPFNLEQQTRVAKQLDLAKNGVTEMRRQAKLLGEELNALLPSILDKAFRGEL
jgi:type I restriction enzyme S subunit